MVADRQTEKDGESDGGGVGVILSELGSHWCGLIAIDSWASSPASSTFWYSRSDRRYFI